MISVVMPSAGRDSVVLRTLEVLRDQRPPEGGHEVIVIDSGMEAKIRAELSAERYESIPLRVERLIGGPAAARNLGIGLARGEVVLFLDDDKAPAGAELIARHAELHRIRPEPSYAVLGAATWTPQRPITQLMSWLEGERGGQFAFPAIDRGPVSAGTYFYTANTSVKKTILERVGGFDERFLDAALEDIELGIRLQAAGLELDYRPELLAWHDHPIDLPGSLSRTVGVGRAAAQFMSIHRDVAHERIRRPSRGKLAVARASRPIWELIARSERAVPLRRSSWRLLHMLAYAEGLLSDHAPDVTDP